MPAGSEHMAEGTPAELMLLERWRDLHEALGRRTLVYLAAPPGTGKSTLAARLERLSAADGGPRVQALPIDGFHYPNAYLQTHSHMEDGAELLLADRKGAWFTYDVDALEHAVAGLADGTTCSWPAYSREVHDPLPDAIAVTGDILLVEGNYLLLGRGPWAALAPYADDTVFMDASDALLERRLVARKAAGGLSPADAQAWYEASDARNIRLVREESASAALTLSVDADGAISAL